MTVSRIAVGICFIALAGCAARGASRSGPITLDRGMADEVHDLGVFGLSGAVLVRDASGTRVSMGVGRARPDGPLIDANTLFDIGSLAKQFTAAAILALSVDGKLTLADTVGRFFPNAPAPIAAIHIEQLLTHTSGLFRGNVTPPGGEETVPTPRDSALTRIFRSKLATQPGATQAYSNAGYVLLAAIIEQASGQSYNDYVRARLFRRAGLRDTRFWGEQGNGVVAAGGDDVGITFDPLLAPLENWTIRGAGAVLSSISELDRWMNALASGRVLPDAVVKSMFALHFGIHGLGWRVGEANTRYAGSAYHGGDYHGFGSQLVWYPATRRLIVILTNVRHEDDTYPTRIVVENAVFTNLEGKPRVTPQIIGPPSANDLMGRYRTDNGSIYEIARNSSGLVIGALNQSAVDRMWNPLPDTAKYWKNLDDRAESLLLGTLRQDTVTVRKSLASTDDPPYVYEQVTRELKELGVNGTVFEVRALGTFPAALPRGAQWTVSKITSSAGVKYYRLRWYQDNIASYHQRSPQLASPWPLAQSDSGFVAWDIIHQVAPISLTQLGGALRLNGAGGSVVLQRVR